MADRMTVTLSQDVIDYIEAHSTERSRGKFVDACVRLHMAGVSPKGILERMVEAIEKLSEKDDPA